MKELQTETNFTAAVNEEAATHLDSGATVSFEPLDEAGGPKDIDGTKYGASEETLETENADPVEGLEAALQAAREALFEDEFIDTEEAEAEEEEVQQGDPSLFYDVPRPALTIDEAATILGKSIRAVERSISGKWGNHLPEGWKARKMKIDGEHEWRIIPPPSFRIRNSKTRTQEMTSSSVNNAVPQGAVQKVKDEVTRLREEAAKLREEATRSRESRSPDLGEGLFGFTLNSLIQTAGKKAKNELVRAAEYAFDNSPERTEHPTIVIDRSDDVEKLLRELADTQRELSEQRRLHLEDLRMLAELQGSMRLLEMNASQTSTLKEDLHAATTALREHKRQYQEFLALPWWKRLFKRTP